MRQKYIDRICAETLSGRFGLSVISPRMSTAITGSSTLVDVVATLRNAAVWTSTRSGGEQGKR